MLRRALPVATLLMAMATAMLPLVTPAPGIGMGGHSSLIELVRVQAIHLAVAGGDLVPRWLPDFYARHGSPLPIFYAPLAYLPVELMRGAGLGATAAIQATFALLWVLAAAGSAWAARRWFGAGAGIAAAAACCLSPWFAADVYVRSGLAEVAGFALLPWLLGAVVRPGRWALVGGALAMAALVLAHNITALFAAGAVALVALAGPRAVRRHAAVAASLGILLSAPFWLSALARTGDVQARESLTGGDRDFRGHFIAPSALLPGRTAVVLPSAVGPDRPVRFGEVLWIALLAAPLAARRARAAEPERAGRVALLGVMTLAAMTMATPITRPLWEHLPGLAWVQFPFRWLLPATVGAALLAGAAVTALPLRWRPHASALAVAVALLLVRPLLEPRAVLIDRSSGAPVWVERGRVGATATDPRLVAPEFYFDAETIRRLPISGTSSDDFLPKAVSGDVPAPGPAAEPAGAAEPDRGGVEVVDSGWGYPSVFAEVRVERPAALALHQFDFPGWRVEVDGVQRSHRTEPVHGRIVVDLEPGDRRVVARFGATRIDYVGRAMALLGLGLLGFVVRWCGPERPAGRC